MPKQAAKKEVLDAGEQETQTTSTGAESKAESEAIIEQLDTECGVCGRQGVEVFPAPVTIAHPDMDQVCCAECLTSLNNER